MEYLKMITLLSNTPNQPSVFRTRGWIEIKDGSRETYHFS